MKKIFLFLYISTAIVTVSSCKKDVLDKVPLDIISDNTVWGDPVLIDAYLTQVYAQMYVFTNETYGNDWNTGESWFAPFAVNEVSDECKANWTPNDYTFKFGNLKIGGGLLEWWENAYRPIRALNEFIVRLPSSPVDADFRKVRTAEAKFLRAYNYFSMVKRYGGVPLITVAQAVDAPADSLYPKRAKEADVYDFVISEMDAIANDLPETNTAADFGRPSKYAALALKARAALYAGSISQFGTVQLDGVIGIDASRKTAYYQAAFDASAAIMASNHYQLYNANPDKAMNFREIFLKKNNVEVIFNRQHSYSDRDQGGNGWSYDFFQCPAPQAWGGGNQDGPYLEMVEEFENIDGSTGTLDRNLIQQGLYTTQELWGNKDPRFFGTIYTQNTSWKGGLLDFHNGILLPDGTIQNDGSYNGVLAKGNQRTNDGTGFGVMKYLDEAKDNFGERGTSGTDWLVFRYAEILLDYAEAAFELGRLSEALDAVNQVRTRAGIATLSSIDRDKIRHERKVELAFEGHRYWDVRRWRTAVADLSVNGSALRYILDAATGKYKLQVIDNVDGTVSVPAFFEFNYYFPITLARTGNNPNLVENPGY